MPTLPDELFSLIERLVLSARETAEEAAIAAINTLAVNRPEPYTSMNEDARQLRRALRAKARQLGEGSQTKGLQPLIEEIAYQQWHRMLFARFLAENNLLMHPSGVAVSMQDCAELAPEEGEADAWGVAAKYASVMLPGIFRTNDPVVQVRFAPEGRIELERILAEIPEVVFKADDSLGWMYQFWQSKKRDEVNSSERRIGGEDLAPVTQLFTENYMVRFLLENSLGAWWAGKYPNSPLLKDYEYLRYKEDGTPAAGTFEGWPKVAAEITVMDPCCGSGHFLVAAFEMLRQMRMAEEGLDATEAGNAVIQDNLHGLELDLRATQIAAFSVALIAWKTGVYRELPNMSIACSGIPVKGSLENWLNLAGNNDRIRRGLKRLYQVFENSPTIGSLIDPIELSEHDPLFTAAYEDISALWEQGLIDQIDSINNIDDALNLYSADLVGVAKVLSKKYSLLITNVPYLLKRKQSELLQEYLQEFHPLARNDLATSFVDRIKHFSTTGSSYAVVLPINWSFQTSDKQFRKKILREQQLDLFVKLGTGAFRTISGEVVNVGLFVFTNGKPDKWHEFVGLDLKNEQLLMKIEGLGKREISFHNQLEMLRLPDARIVLVDWGKSEFLSKSAISLQGIVTGDDGRYKRYFWEFKTIDKDWKYILGTTDVSKFYGGREKIIFWHKNGDHLARRQGMTAWNKLGVLVNRMGTLECSLYTGEAFDINVAAVVPSEPKDLLALWAYCSSDDYNEIVREIDSKLNVTNATLLQVPFDKEKWQKIAEEKLPDGFPEPYSDDPTQWIFDGIPVGSTDPLQVAVARLLGYRWPEQGKDVLDNFVDEDGIVPLITAGREEPAADRLRALLAVVYGDEWSPEKQRHLLAKVDFTGKTLEEWLSDGFFKQHVKLFKNRPFIWHIWDGRKDGFHALVNYHKLDAVALDKLIYTYLGSWIELQRGHRNHGEPGADGRLVAALELKEKLEAIREGKPPYDIYVRWKTLAEQPIGWNPDLNDGVRLNIRPFVEAGVLRNKFTINWKKDRGKNPDGSERHNDLHYTNEEKRAARR